MRQIRMLAIIVRADGRLLSREDLFRAAAGRQMRHGSRAVDMDLWRIRRALGVHAGLVRSVRKIGYALNTSFTHSFPERDAADTRS